MRPPFSHEHGRLIYFPGDGSGKHTQWPFGPDDATAMDRLIAGYGPQPSDLSFPETMEADAIARLRDRIGSAILLTHSASGPVVWRAATSLAGRSADRASGLVQVPALTGRPILAVTAEASAGKRLPMRDAVHARMSAAAGASMGGRDRPAIADLTINHA